MRKHINPTPVAVALIGIQEEHGVGLLSIQRQNSMSTGAGGWALPGGFIEQEIAEHACQRETEEEVCLALDSSLFSPFATRLGGNNNDILLIFCQYTRLILPEQLNNFLPNNEVAAIKVWHGEDSLIFPHHDEIGKLWLQSKQPIAFFKRKIS